MSYHAFIKRRHHKHEKIPSMQRVEALKCTLLASRHWVNSIILIDVCCANYRQSASLRHKKADVVHHHLYNFIERHMSLSKS